MAAIIFEKTPGGLIATGDRTVSTFASGMVRVDRKYVCASANAATHRATLAAGEELPEDDGTPATDGLFIFPQPQEVQRGDGFTEFQVSAYGRTTDKAGITRFEQRSGILGNPTTTGMSYKLWQLAGTMVVPTGDAINYEDLGIDDTLVYPFDAVTGINPAATYLETEVLDTDTTTRVVGNIVTDNDGRLLSFATRQTLGNEKVVIRKRRKYLIKFAVNGTYAPGLDRTIWLDDPVTKISTSRYFGVWSEIDFVSERELPATEEI